MAVSKIPTVKIKAPPAPKAPPVTSKTQDNFSHHTSPVKGPQPTAVENNPISSKPKLKIRTLPDTPGPKYKHDENS
jgi:hypothetical protein